MRKAFTLVEVLIVVAIIGIMAAIVIPTFRGHIQQAKEAAAKDDLRILRNAIELYASQHNGVPPGYSGNKPTGLVTPLNVYNQLFFKGKYLSGLPKNPFNDRQTIEVLPNGLNFPTNAAGTTGWIYQPATKTIKLD